MPIDIKSILSDLKNKIVDFARTSFKDLVDEAASDGKELLATIKADLTRWIQLLADGQITKDEFKTLLIGKKDLIEMSALTEAGLAIVKIDEFKTGILNLIIDTISGAIKL